MQALKSAVLFVLLARYNNDQSDLMHRIYEEKQLQHIPLYRWVYLSHACGTCVSSHLYRYVLYMILTISVSVYLH